jgi:hypothetical protein
MHSAQMPSSHLRLDCRHFQVNVAPDGTWVMVILSQFSVTTSLGLPPTASANSSEVISTTCITISRRRVAGVVAVAGVIISMVTVWRNVPLAKCWYRSGVQSSSVFTTLVSSNEAFLAIAPPDTNVVEFDPPNATLETAEKPGRSGFEAPWQLNPSNLTKMLFCCAKHCGAS